jgi:hypothetical protein
MDPTEPARQWNRPLALFACALPGILALAALSGCALARMSGRNGPRSMMLIDTGRDRRGANLAAAPAVGPKQIDQRLAAAGAATGGEVEVSLAWNSPSDLDLEVREPSGELITAHHPRSASGGVQDVDANPTLLTEEGSRRATAGLKPGAENVIALPELFFDLDKKVGLPHDFPGFGDAPGGDGKAPSRFTRTPVEHVYFAHAPQGTYVVYAHCYSWRERNRYPLPFTVQLRSHGRVFYQTSGTLGPASYCADDTRPTQVCRFVMR